MTNAAKITAAIKLLTSLGYRVTPPPAPVGRPPRVGRQAIEAAIRERPDASNVEIADLLGCSASHVGNIRTGRR